LGAYIVGLMITWLYRASSGSEKARIAWDCLNRDIDTDSLDFGP